jgi:hypothetical protein
MTVMIIIYCILARNHYFAVPSNYAASNTYMDSSMIRVTLDLLKVLISSYDGVSWYHPSDMTVYVH